MTDDQLADVRKKLEAARASMRVDRVPSAVRQLNEAIALLPAESSPGPADEGLVEKGRHLAWRMSRPHYPPYGGDRDHEWRQCPTCLACHEVQEQEEAADAVGAFVEEFNRRSDAASRVAAREAEVERLNAQNMEFAGSIGEQQARLLQAEAALATEREQRQALEAENTTLHAESERQCGIVLDVTERAEQAEAALATERERRQALAVRLREALPMHGHPDDAQALSEAERDRSLAYFAEQVVGILEALR